MSDASSSDDPLPFSAAAERNKAPILDVLRRVVPRVARVLEVASGTGQHAAHFARECPGWRWQPSEADAALRQAIDRRCAALENVAPALALDVLREPWPTALGRFDAVYCANLLHISPWPACGALMRGARMHLADAGVLAVYGPFFADGEAPSPGNVAFDADLRRRDPRWGVRRLADVTREATAAGLELEQRFAMPANNLTLVFRSGR